MRHEKSSCAWRWLRGAQGLRSGLFVLMLTLLAGAPVGWAQEQVPLTPPPPEGHDVKRMGTEPEPPAPPSLPPEEIIQRFAHKEDQFASVRPTYTYRKSLRIQEFGPDGNAVGEFSWVTEIARAPNGQLISKTVQKPQSTLRYVRLEPEDAKELDRIPPFPLTTAQLAKYDVKYIGQEQVDEIDTYIFQVKPKALDRTHAYFDGIVWVDKQYLEVVKTYGRWVNELGDVHVANLPFTTYETYRENVAGKYWFPNYERSDETLHLKDVDVTVRLVIKWSDFKPLPAAQSPPQGATEPSSQPAAKPVEKP